ncbi:uncharacterized protein LOC131149225 isoform X2 [Malania oleifera]|uniref:uncharacterized protein LOC131149225 isoform X2 n=1 Tax=Malania oleifera TaxID=397392 RepID=UPI0025AE9FED|nr:uncharacterized protein LOC131149225 isoform X2 [Malania oleifera]
MAASVAGRSAFLRIVSRTKMTNSRTTVTRFSMSQSRISPTGSSFSRFLRRELSTLLPVHSAIASACLVSKLPSELSASIEGTQDKGKRPTLVTIEEDDDVEVGEEEFISGRTPTIDAFDEDEEL